MANEFFATCFSAFSCSFAIPASQPGGAHLNTDLRIGGRFLNLDLVIWGSRTFCGCFCGLWSQSAAKEVANMSQTMILSMLLCFISCLDVVSGFHPSGVGISVINRGCFRGMTDAQKPGFIHRRNQRLIHGGESCRCFPLCPLPIRRVLPSSSCRIIQAVVRFGKERERERERERECVCVCV